ncbi:uncharacterized protein LOC122246663 [Penaeus japonicus]|uniref:uncharacterized protein LOC122246663 n=1 Tax=Penaeus japonicus TaxID=27405 RepID=UPI001C716DE2|nr:uncharacterized protein LOC122246663 [Penaeus japonicus]
MMVSDHENSHNISEYISFDDDTNEEDIEAHFPRRFQFLKAVGVYIGQKGEDGRYTFHTKKLLVAYIAWYFIPMLTFVLAELWYILEDHQNTVLFELFQSPVFVGVCVLIPLIKTHSLKSITETLQRNMELLPKLPKDRCKHTKKKDEGQSKGNTKDEATHVAFGTGIFSVTVFLFYSVYELITYSEETFDRLLDELPPLLVDLIYQILPFMTTFLIITFLDYYTNLYKHLHHKLQDLCDHWTDEAAKDLLKKIEDTQHTFRSLMVGFLQYALTTNVTIILLLAIFTTYRLSQGVHEIVYLLPGGVSTIMVLLISYHVHTLRRKGEKLTRLARVKAREARRAEPTERYQTLRTIQAVLQESPPEARIYGNLPVGYGLIPLVAVFVLAYTGLLTSTESDVVLNLEGGAANTSLSLHVEGRVRQSCRCS